MLLFCCECESYKSKIDPGEGEILYEQEGEVEPRDVVPLVEGIPDLSG